MDESRKQFEEWIKFQSDEDEMNGKLERANSGSNYADSTTDICWIAWQASRAAIELEFPEAELVYSTATDTYGEDGCLMLPVETIARVLNDAGIKVKE